MRDYLEYMEQLPTDKAENTEDDVRAKTSEKITSFLEKTNAYEKIESILDQHKEKINFEEFMGLIVRLNGIIRDIPIHERSIDGERVQVEGWIDSYIPPRQSDKEGLLKKAYESSSHVDDEDVKYLIPAVINAVHLFLDGNGRTARLLHQILKKHDSKNNFLDDIKKAMDKDGRYETFNINPGLIAARINDILLARHGWTSDHNRLGVFRSGLLTLELDKMDKEKPKYPLIKELVTASKQDAFYVVTAIHEISSPEQAQQIVSKKYRDGISLEKMEEVLSEEELKEILERFWELKKEYVDILIDIFVKPDEYKTTNDEKEIRVKDLFINKIKEEAEMK